MRQHRQLQLHDGHNNRPKHVPRGKAEEDGERVGVFLLLLQLQSFTYSCTECLCNPHSSTKHNWCANSLWASMLCPYCFMPSPLFVCVGRHCLLINEGLRRDLTILVFFQWAKIQSGKFDVLEHQMDPSSNFLSYRSTFNAAISRSEAATDDRQRVTIPFFSLFVKDLYFAKESSGMCTKSIATL